MDATEAIEKYLGMPYIVDGRDIKTGIDCYGLMLSLIKDLFNVELPDPEYALFKRSTLEELHGEITDEELINKFKEYNFEISDQTGDTIIDIVDISAWVNKIEKPPYKLGDILIIVTEHQLPIHMGVYIISGKFLQAIHPQGVVLCSIKEWKNKIAGIYRLKPQLQQE